MGTGVVNKPFDAADLPALVRWVDMFEDLAAEAAARAAVTADCQMRRWEYGHLLEHAAPSPGMRVIDIGCDKTYFPVALRECGAEVFAVDMNLDEQTEYWFRDRGAHCLRYDALRLPYPDNYFDRVFSVCVGEHIGDTSMRGWAWSSYPEKLMVSLDIYLKECIRLLKPGGIMAHTFDYYFPEAGSQIAGLNADMARTVQGKVYAASPLGSSDFGMISYERNIPEDYQTDPRRAHTAVAMLWRKH
jgi:SAM-dependent methyltransferase